MKEFERFKKRLMRRHALKSALLSLAVGFAMAGLAVLLFRLTAPELTVVFAIALGVLSAIGSFFLFFVRMRPSDKELALRIDKELGLNERCATMVEFKDSDNAFMGKQREDANARLSSKPSSALKLRISAASVVLLALAAGALAGSMFVPAREASAADPYADSASDVRNPSSEGDIDDEAHEIAESEKSDIDDNGDIDSQLAEDLKSIIDELEENLSGERDQSARDSMAEEAKQKADEAVEKANQGADEGRQSANERAGEEAKEAMDQMADPSQGQGEQSSEGQQGSEGQGQETASGEGSEEGQEGQGSGEQSGSGEGQEGQGEGDEQGQGAGAGEAGDHHTDTVYTQDGEVEYGDIIDACQGEAANDADEVGDEELIDLQGDYFDALYGEER